MNTLKIGNRGWPFGAATWHRVTFRGDAVKLGSGSLRWRTEQAVLHFTLPLTEGLDTYVIITPAEGSGILSSATGQFEQLSLVDHVLAYARIRYTSLSSAVLHFGDLRIAPEGPKKVTRPFRKQVSFQRRAGIDVEGELLEQSHERHDVGKELVADKICHQTSLKVAFVLHLFYTELLEEFLLLFARSRLSFSLFVTLTREDFRIRRRIEESFPDAMVIVVDNAGRDVRPFLVLLESGELDQFDVVLKVHGKRSMGGGRLAHFGDIVRKRILNDLLGDPATLGATINAFETKPNLGIVGPKRMHQVSKPDAPRDLFGRNRTALGKLAALMGIPIDDNSFDFFEGTMFWVRPRCLAKLRPLRMASGNQWVETGAIDGALEHALERLFCCIVRSEGFDVGECSSHAAP